MDHLIGLIVVSGSLSRSSHREAAFTKGSGWPGTLDKWQLDGARQSIHLMLKVCLLTTK